MNVADVISQYGAYYKAGGQGVQDLRKLMYLKGRFDNLFTFRPTQDTIVRLAESTISSIAQPFQKGWTPKGAVAFTPNEIQLRGTKVDFEETPDDLEETWLGFLASEDIDRSKWPFIRWLVEVHLVPKWAEEVELEAKYLGVYAAPTNGTAGAASTIVNGIRKVINDAVTAGSITPIVTGALDTADQADLVNKIETFAKGINTRYRGKQMTIACSMDVYDAFREGMDTKYNTNYQQAGNVKVKRFENLTVEGFEAMGSSTKIWCTPKENAIKAVRGAKNAEVFELQRDHREVHLFSDMHLGYGFGLHAAVFTNDQDLV